MSRPSKVPEATVARQPPQRVSVELGAVLLDTLGLVEAVEWHLQRFQKRTGILCDLTVRNATRFRLPEESAETIFDIYCEALGKIAGRALATRAAVVLTITELDVALVVKDDRVGTTVRTSVPVAS